MKYHIFYQYKLKLKLMCYLQPQNKNEFYINNLLLILKEYQMNKKLTFAVLILTHDNFVNFYFLLLIFQNLLLKR